MARTPYIALFLAIGLAMLLALVIPFKVAHGQTVSTSSTQRFGQGGRSFGRNSADQQAIAALSGTATQSVLMPVLFGVSFNDISPNFGDPRDGGTRTHEGEDIMATKGTPVVSPTDAVVLSDQVGVSEGNAVYTANPGGETFVYMHLDRFGEGVVAGTVLHAGSLIGYVGNTGDAAGGPAHLHFEIHNPSGTPTNPFPRLTSDISLANKISYLSTILMQTTDPTALSQFLVSNFHSTFTAALAANIALPTQIVSALVTPAAALVRDLKKGMTGEDVRALQVLLNSKGFTVASTGSGSVGNETDYFGFATLAAVIKFQLSKSVVPSVGYVGPLTRAALASA